MEEYFEYAVRIDCAKNDCETPHSDDGLVWSDGGRLRLLPQEINRHAVTRVRRLIGEWEVDSDASGGQMRDRNEPAWVPPGETKRLASRPAVPL
jgi:hypothetical protein